MSTVAIVSYTLYLTNHEPKSHSFPFSHKTSNISGVVKTYNIVADSSKYLAITFPHRSQQLNCYAQERIDLCTKIQINAYEAME